MTKRFLPTTAKKYLQSNRSDVYPLANLVGTMNLDFQSNLGVMRVSPRLRLVSSTTDDADLGCPVAFKRFGGKIWAICDAHIFNNSGEPDDAFTDDATTSFQTDYQADESDLELFNATLCATSTDGLFSTNGSAWTQRDTLSTGGAHMLTYFKKFDRLYYSNLSDKIISIDTGWVTADPGADYAITLSTDSDGYTITSLKAGKDYVWIGVTNQNTNGTKGKVLQWDGISRQIQAEYPLGDAQGCLAIAIDPKTDLPYAMGADGILYGFTGSGFSEVGRLPFAGVLPYNIADSDNERFIHPNGLIFTKNGTILANVNNRANTGDVPEFMPSGIWEWSKDFGFTHKHSPTYNPIGGSTITDFGQNRISRVGAIASMQVPSTGNVDGTLLAGYTFYTDASSSKSGIFADNSLDTIKKAGRFTTAWWESDEIEDNWLKLWIVLRRLLDSADKLVFKYRLEEEVPVYTDITWVDTTHFTTATDLSAYAPTATGFDGTYGGELDVLRGTGAGQLRHITAISAISAGLYTVTIDSAVTGVTTGTASARFQKWIKLLPEISGQVISYAGLPIVRNSPRIQIRGFMEWTGKNEFHKLGLYSTDFLDVQE